MGDKKTGRPSDLTPELEGKLLSMIRAGAPLQSACAACGIGYSTLNEWRRRGEGTHKRKATPEYQEFSQKLSIAEAQAEVNLVALIRAAVPNDWRAGAWLLERRFSDRWSNTQRLQILCQQELDKTLGLLEQQLPAATFNEVLLALADDSGLDDVDE